MFKTHAFNFRNLPDPGHLFADCTPTTVSIAVLTWMPDSPSDVQMTLYHFDPATPKRTLAEFIYHRSAFSGIVLIDRNIEHADGTRSFRARWLADCNREESEWTRLVHVLTGCFCGHQPEKGS